MGFLNFKIDGSTPAKKNANKITCAGKFPRTYKTQRFKDWHEDAMWQLKSPLRGVSTLKTTHSITLSFYVPDKRKRDLTNMAESIMDLMVDAGLLEDDNWKVCPCVQLMFGGVSKKPRCEVEISF